MCEPSQQVVVLTKGPGPAGLLVRIPRYLKREVMIVGRPRCNSGVPHLRDFADARVGLDTFASGYGEVAFTAPRFYGRTGVSCVSEKPISTVLPRRLPQPMMPKREARNCPGEQERCRLRGRDGQLQ
jgi:hypothetical protein